MVVVRDAPAVHVRLRLFSDERLRLGQAFQESFQEGASVLGPGLLEELHEFRDAEQSAEKVRGRTAVSPGMVIGVGPEDKRPVTLEEGMAPATGVTHVAPVVVETAVAVPERAHHPKGIGVVAMDESAAHARIIVHFHVGDDLLDEDVAGHRLNVQFPLHGGPVLAVDGALQEGELLPDIVPDLPVGILGILDGGGHPEHFGPEVVRRIRLVIRPVIDVQGKENALFRIQFHPVTALLHLLGGHVQAHVLSVQGDRGVADVIGIRKSQLLGQIETHEVHHVRDVPVVRQQHPVLVRGHPEEGGRDVQLDPVGFLRIPVPGGIAPAANLPPDRHRILVFSGYLHGAGSIVGRILRIHRHAAVRRDIDPRNHVRGEGNVPGEGLVLPLFNDVLPARQKSGGKDGEDDMTAEGHCRWNLYKAKVRPPRRSLKTVRPFPLA